MVLVPWGEENLSAVQVIQSVVCLASISWLCFSFVVMFAWALKAQTLFKLCWIGLLSVSVVRLFCYVMLFAFSFHFWSFNWWNCNYFFPRTVCFHFYFEHLFIKRRHFFFRLLLVMVNFSSWCEEVLCDLWLFCSFTAFQWNSSIGLKDFLKLAKELKEYLIIFINLVAWVFGALNLMFLMVSLSTFGEYWTHHPLRSYKERKFHFSYSSLMVEKK